MTTNLEIKDPHFLVLGRAGMDLYADPPGTTIEDADNFKAMLGGSSANIAAGLTRQGCRASLVSTVSEDSVGRYVLAQLAKFGIDARHVSKVAGENRTSLAVVETRAQNCQSVIYRNGAADFAMTADLVRSIDYAAYGAFIFTGTSLACEPSRQATIEAIELARKSQLPVIMDVDYRPYSWPSIEEASRICRQAAEAADIVIGNDEEFAVLAGQGADGSAYAANLAKARGGVSVYKMGALGSITYGQQGSFKTGIFEVTALKPTGAGDAFMAGFCSALSRSLPLETCVANGSAAAAIVVSRVGCAAAMPTTAEIRDFIENYAINNPGKVAPNAHSTL